jgi:tellurite methyltransferase
MDELRQEPVMAADALFILDVRPAAAFAAGHFPGSGHLPESEWESRRSELPPRDQSVLVVAETPDRSRAAAGHLAELGYARAFALEAPIESLPDARGVGPSAPLWRPAPYLEWALDTFASRIARGRAADLACGAGRDAVFLARRGFEVEAWDRAPEALARARELARVSEARITTVECDLERGVPALAPARYALIVCFRFLHRPLFPAIAAALAPGGVLIYETYRTGQERFGRPTHTRFLLEPGELDRAFPALELLHHAELDPEPGPVTSRLVARRPAGGESASSVSRLGP